MIAPGIAELGERIERAKIEVRRLERTDFNWKAYISEFGRRPMVRSLVIVTGLPQGLIENVAEQCGIDIA